MAAHFASIIDVVSSNDAPISAPQKSITRSHRSVQDPNLIELNNLQLGQNFNRQSACGTTIPRPEPVSGSSTPGWQTPRTPSVFKISLPQTPNNEPENIVQSFFNPPQNRFRMLATCLLNFGNGLSDAAAGPLIPEMIMYVQSFLSDNNIC